MKFFKLDVIQTDLIERVFHGVLNVVKLIQNEAVDHGKRVDKNRRAGIQIIDQSRDENKRKDIDKHQAVRAQADGRPMKLKADSIFHAFNDIILWQPWGKSAHRERSAHRTAARRTGAHSGRAFSPGISAETVSSSRMHQLLWGGSLTTWPKQIKNSVRVP